MHRYMKISLKLYRYVFDYHSKIKGDCKMLNCIK